MYSRFTKASCSCFYRSQKGAQLLHWTVKAIAAFSSQVMRNSKRNSRDLPYQQSRNPGNRHGYNKGGSRSEQHGATAQPNYSTGRKFSPNHYKLVNHRYKGGYHNVRQNYHHPQQHPYQRYMEHQYRHHLTREQLYTFSKKLSYILRHEGRSMNIGMTSDGFVDVDTLLRLGRFRGCGHATIMEIVQEDKKKRFSVREHPQTKQLQIRANQGHSFEVNDLELKEITHASQIRNAIHGTYYGPWHNFISIQGLSRMRRQHIHFATGPPGERGVRSGFRHDTEVLIYVNLAKALQDGYKFYLSENDVVLCPGNDDGILPATYFKKVVDRWTGQELLQG